jgi:AraC-like DNA-binding protein
MNAAELALPAQYVGHIANEVRSRGADVPAWLAQSGVSEAQLDDAAHALPYGVFRRLVLDSLLVTGEPALGLFVGQRLQANMHGILGYAALSSGSLREALALFERFVALRIPVLAISSEPRAREVRVRVRELRPLGDIQRPVLEAVLMAVKNILDFITMGGCRIVSVAFPFEEPEYAELARELLRCEVRYRQPWAGFTLPRDGLDTPLRMADAGAFRQAAAILERELERLEANETHAGRVRRLLLEGQGGFPSLHVAARTLHMTPRTLHRRLIDEGTSYRDLLAEVRHTLALEHLKAGRSSIDEIAYMLGYSDLANFRRAFKRWEAVPPGVYRAQLEARSRRKSPKGAAGKREPRARKR